MSHQVLLFYKYVSIDDPEALAARIRDLARAYHLLGRVLIAEEGINGTLEGTLKETEAFAADLLADVRFSDMPIKRSAGTGLSFPKLSVKVRPEIVGTRFPADVDPRKETAPRLTPEELRAWFERGETFEIIDMRNDYEFRSGHFKGSINPGLENSRDLPAALPKLEHLKGKKVLTVCTGGVRCEKMSAYLMKQGFTDVYQLDNGMHGYMEAYPGKDFLGTLYTFDRRLVMDFGGEREIIGRCHVCESPTEQYVNCRNTACHLHFLLCDSCNEAEGTFCSTACKEKVSATADA